MKYLPLIWAALWRRPARTLLTMLALVASFLLFGLLQGVNFGFAGVLEDQRLDRLLTDPRAVAGAPMPSASRDVIMRVPGVTQVANRAVFWGYFREEKNGFGALATDVRKWFDVRPEFRVAPEVLEKLAKTRDGLVATPDYLKEYGWKVGDRIPIQSTFERKDGETVWTFELVGVVDFLQPTGGQWVALINYDFFDEMRVKDRGTVDRFIVRIKDPARAAQTAAAIDALFANSSHETFTQSEKEMAQSSIKEMGDIAFFVNAIVAAVFFTLLFVTANAMAQSVRERIPELAVLKTIGFPDSGVMLLILAEAGLLCITSAVVGLSIAAALFPHVTGKQYGFKSMSGSVIVAGVAAALLVALICAVFPARRARRLSIVDALAGN